MALTCNNNRIAHEYRDFGLEAALLERQQTRRADSPPGHTDPFPVHLHWMLQQMEKVGLCHVVGWSPHGRAFGVHDRDQFVEEILPIYFKQSKITSFQRQLSLYGFKRLTKGPDSGSYYHPQFLRNSRTFARNITRTKIKNDGPRKAASPESEPDLYSFPKLPSVDSVLEAKIDRTASELLSESLRSSEQAYLPFANLRRSSGIPSPSLSGGFASNRLKTPPFESDLLRNRFLSQQLIEVQQQNQRLLDTVLRDASVMDPNLSAPISSRSALSSNAHHSWLLGSSSSLLNDVLPTSSALSTRASTSLTGRNTWLPLPAMSSSNVANAPANMDLSKAVSTILYGHGLPAPPGFTPSKADDLGTKGLA